MIFYDQQNHAAAWAKLKKLYFERKLPGVIKISSAKTEKEPGKGIALLAFAGPTDDEEHCLRVGQTLVERMRHVRQYCNGQYDQKIYFKGCKSSHINLSVSY